MDRKKKEDEEAVRTLEVASLELNNIRRALDQSAIVAITDRKGDIIHVNEKFCEISKYNRAELLGKNHRLINSGHHSREFFVTMWKSISTGKVWEGEIKNRAKDGSFYWVNTTIVPFLDQGGAPYQYVSIRYEITQRKMAEDQLLVYADRLERSNAELQDFASIAAHDLQEPLRKIQTFGDRLGSRWKAALGEEGGDYLNRMLASVTRMRKLIDDLLTYSRVTTETLPFESTDLNKVLRDVLSDLEVRIDQVKGKVHADTLPSLEADPSQMRQLFQNLISNALKFHKVGEPPVIRISSTIRNDAFCTISFVDNGVGFESKDAVRMFAIFQRLHGKHEYEGTGVGLAVCRRIVERHGGSIVAKGKVGEGASFEVTLPLVRRLS